MKKIIFALTAFVVALGSSFSASAQNSVTLPSFADLVEKLSPSVVNISSTQKPQSFEGGEVVSLKNLPGQEDKASQVGQEHYALGSGFLIDEDGYIITNSHVIDQAAEINVILSDNSQHQAKVIGTDNKTDLALIKITTDKKLTPVKLGDSDKIRVGDWVLAIGNPFGLGGSVTSGIVSAKSRDIESGPYDNYIQTDASINQGSSGGPMFNLDGEVIGINTAIFSTTGGSMGIGFAIPVNNAQFVISELKKSGTVSRGWIGVRVQPQLTGVSNGNNIPQGILISSISTDSPAALAGIEAGDIILALNGKDVDSAQNFSRLVSESTIGSDIKLKIWRNNAEETIFVNVKEMPENSAPTIAEEQTEQPVSTPIEENTNDTTTTSAETGQSLGDILRDTVSPKTAETATTAPTPTNYETLETKDIAPEIAPADVNDSSSYMIPGTGMMVRNITMDDISEMDLKPDTMGVIVVSTIPNSDAAIKGLRPGVIISQINQRPLFNTNSIKNAIYDKAEDNNYSLTVLDGDNVNNVTLKIKE